MSRLNAYSVKTAWKNKNKKHSPLILHSYRMTKATVGVTLGEAMMMSNYWSSRIWNLPVTRLIHPWQSVLQHVGILVKVSDRPLTYVVLSRQSSPELPFRQKKENLFTMAGCCQGHFQANMTRVSWICFKSVSNFPSRFSGQDFKLVGLCSSPDFYNSETSETHTHTHTIKYSKTYETVIDCIVPHSYLCVQVLTPRTSECDLI